MQAGIAAPTADSTGSATIADLPGRAAEPGQAAERFAHRVAVRHERSDDRADGAEFEALCAG